jgi:hypothetical protein
MCLNDAANNESQVCFSEPTILFTALIERTLWSGSVSFRSDMSTPAFITSDYYHYFTYTTQSQHQKAISYITIAFHCLYKIPMFAAVKSMMINCFYLRRPGRSSSPRIDFRETHRGTSAFNAHKRAKYANSHLVTSGAEWAENNCVKYIWWDFERFLC